MLFDEKSRVELKKHKIIIDAHHVNCKDEACLCRIALSLIKMVETVYERDPPQIDENTLQAMNDRLPSCKDWPTIWDPLRHACDHVRFYGPEKSGGISMLGKAMVSAITTFEENQEEE
jgi:hypothetical protein